MRMTARQKLFEVSDYVEQRITELSETKKYGRMIKARMDSKLAAFKEIRKKIDIVKL